MRPDTNQPPPSFGSLRGATFFPGAPTTVRAGGNGTVLRPGDSTRRIRGMLRSMEWIVTLTPAVGADPLEALGRPPEGATVVELRGDLLPDLDPAHAVARCPLPVLYTLRSQTEGGRGPSDPETRSRSLARARDAGVALLDLEAARDTGLIRELGLNPAQVILSWHDTDGVPDDLPERAEALLESPAGLVKAVTTPRSAGDLGRVLALTTRFNRSRHRKRLVAFGMGPFGLASRYLAPLIGPRVAYAAWSGNAAAAPGQVPLERLQAAIGHLHGPPRTIQAVVGSHVGSSLSPVLHGAGYRAAGLHGVMVPLTVRDEAELAPVFTTGEGNLLTRSTGIPVGGLAVTTPWKDAALAAATVASPRARRAGAANTLVPSSSGLLAENTDADGIRGSLVAADIETAGATAVVQGTGGAARGAAVGLDLAGARVLLRGRDAGHTAAVAAQLGVEALGPADAAPRGAILVNATPLGHHPEDPLPFAPEEIAKAAAVVDMVYGGPVPLGEIARKAGVPSIDGIEVLLHQGLAQFAAMTRTVPPRRSMEAVLRAISGQR